MMLNLHFARNAVLGLVVAAAVAGCTGRGAAPTSVLRTEDFIADPATMPTANAPSPVESTSSAPKGTPTTRAALSVAQAREGVKDLSVKRGVPPPRNSPLAASSESLVLVDAKIGEINGRPIRVDEMFDPAQGATRLAQIAETQRLTRSDWFEARISPPNGDVNYPATREVWRSLAAAIFRNRLEQMLRDEVLTAEARAELKPDEKHGLQYFVQEQRENRRRAAGGSKAELERQLRQKNQTEGRFSKDIETQVLIETQVQDKFRSRLKTSWKDVRLYYERNQQTYRPPLKARFRGILIGSDNADGVAEIMKALAAHQPFSEVASLPVNEYRPEEGGLFPDAEFKGPFSQGDFFSASELNAAARTLTKGNATAEPIERLDQSGKKVLMWLYLDDIIDNSRPLSDPDVQMEIVQRLDSEALNIAVNAYIDRLKKRASFTDIETMTQTLVDIATERYWPTGS